MITYTVISDFTILPQNIQMSIGDILIKFEDAIVVDAKGTYITQETFYSWVGSRASADVIEYTSTEEDSSNPVSLAPIDPESNYETSDIVAKVNNIINVITG